MTNETIGESSIFLQALEKSSLLAKINRPILILGERGSGKELISSRLHYLSDRWEGPFIKINCSTLSSELLESQLFGHQEGSFTGAHKDHRGFLERAQDGTIFLDEIGTISPQVQEKLLRVLEYGEYERLGGEKTLTTNARVISATNRDLELACLDGEFRYDLLDRLSFDVIYSPPLKERGEDIILLAHHFAKKMVRELGDTNYFGFSEQVENDLRSHQWPGNIRELKNTVERTIYHNFPLTDPVTEIHLTPFSYTKKRSIIAEEQKDNPTHILSSLIKKHKSDYSNIIDEVSKIIVNESLDRNKHNKVKTAQELNISYNQLRGILKRIN